MWNILKVTGAHFLLLCFNKTQNARILTQPFVRALDGVSLVPFLGDGQQAPDNRSKPIGIWNKASCDNPCSFFVVQ